MFLFNVGAKEMKGEGALKNMRRTIEMHVHGSKDVMFDKAEDAMMKQLRDLMLCHIWYFLLQSNETRNTATQTYMCTHVSVQWSIFQCWFSGRSRRKWRARCRNQSSCHSKQLVSPSQVKETQHHKQYCTFHPHLKYISISVVNESTCLKQYVLVFRCKCWAWDGEELLQWTERRPRCSSLLFIGKWITYKLNILSTVP